MRGLLLAAVLALLAPHVAAQVVAPFDPGRDLEGFEDRNLSEFSDVYPIDAFLAYAGQPLAGEELARVRRQWAEERDRADARAAAIQADPRELYLYHHSRRLAKTSYFSKIAWTEDRSYPPFVIYVQKPSKDDPTYAASVARFHGPWLQKLEQVYEAQVVKPLGLTRKADFPALAVFLLASPGDFDNFLQSGTRRSGNLFAAVYEPPLKLVVGREDPFTPGIQDPERRFPVLFECARALQHATYVGEGWRPGSLWLHEGLALSIAWHDGLAPKALDQGAVDPRALSTLVSACRDAAKRLVLLHPVEDLVRVRTMQELWDLAKKRASDVEQAEPAWEEVLESFLAQSTLWMRFLRDGAGGKHLPALQRFVKSAMNGACGLDVFRISFAGTDLAALDRDFYRWAYQRHQRAFPKERLDAADLETLFAGRTPGESAGSATGEPDTGTADEGGLTTPLPVPKLTPAVLAIAAEDVEARHGIALVRARAGDLEGAQESLRELASGSPVEAERIARDLERLAQLALLRDGFLDSLIRSGAKWTLEHEGRKVVATVAGVADGFVLLAGNRQGVERIPLSALSPSEIARQADKREEQGGAEPWARAYAMLLAGDPKWDRMPKDAAEPARILREDAQAWIPGLLRTGAAATALDALSRAPMPATREEGEALVEPIRALLASFADVVLVQKRLDPLKKIAAAALEPTWVEQDPGELVHGRYTFMGNGKVSLVYEFDREEEGQDFHKQTGYLKDWRKAMPAVATKEDQAAWTVRDGGFQGDGAACYRHVLGFAAPLTVRYEVAVLSSERAQDSRPTFMVGVCDDGAQSNILAINWNGLRIEDRASKFVRNPSKKSDFTYFLDAPYHFEIRHDGATVSTWLEGERTEQAPSGGRTSGGIFLWFHTDTPISIRRLEIEGRFDPAARETLRADFVKRKLVELGFR